MLSAQEADEVLGVPKAITAVAQKLARLVYRMLKFGEEHVDQGTQ
jgi:hypothetical protein